MTGRKVPGVVIALGFVSMFMDISSEMIHSLLPVFLVRVLGLDTLAVGFIEGIGEAAAAITKTFSGIASDWLGRRKPLVLLGYGMAAATKPLFALAQGTGTVLTARLVDRIGKGIRGAPRDALVADVTPESMRGAAYGTRQSMDTIGAFAGPALAVALMAFSGDNFRFVFWIAVFPALLSVVFAVFGVREPETRAAAASTRFPLTRDAVRRLGSGFWLVATLAAALTLARFSEAFLLLRAANLGVGPSYIPTVLIAMNVVYAASSYPFGRLADRLDRGKLLAAGIAFLIAADLVLAAANAVWLAFAGTVLWGLHMGATQGLLSAMVATTAPGDLRGTAFGLFNLITGASLLAASVVAGFLWAHYGPAVTFRAGAAFAALALFGLAIRGAGTGSR